LPKWKLFNRSKRKEDTSTEFETTIHRIRKSEEKPKIPEIREESEVPIKVYNEMLYSKEFIQKKPTIMPSEKKQSLKRSSWENLRTIERKIDDRECKNTEVSGNRIQTSYDINQKVDHVLTKKKVWQ
jgi:hypothetical protein